MIDRFVARVLEGMMFEERAWRIFSNFDSGTHTVSDIGRAALISPGSIPEDLDSVEHQTFQQGLDDEKDSAYEEAKNYVRYRVTRAGLIFALQFWRKNPWPT